MSAQNNTGLIALLHKHYLMASLGKAGNEATLPIQIRYYNNYKLELRPGITCGNGLWDYSTVGQHACIT